MKDDREIFGIPVSGEFESDASRQLHNAIQAGTLFGGKPAPILRTEYDNIRAIFMLVGIALFAGLGTSFFTYDMFSPPVKKTITRMKPSPIPETGRVNNPVLVENYTGSGVVYDNSEFYLAKSAWYRDRAGLSYTIKYDKKGNRYSYLGGE